MSWGNQQTIGGLGPNPPGRMGCQVGDEPRNRAEVDEIDLGVDTVRAADPDALIIVNLGNPDGNVPFSDFVDHFGAHPEVDVISYDLYSDEYSEHGQLEATRSAALSNRHLGRLLRRQLGRTVRHAPEPPS